MIFGSVLNVTVTGFLTIRLWFLLHLDVNPSLRESLSVGTFKCLHHPTVAGSRVLANRTLAVLLYFVRTRLFSKSAVKLASTSGKLFGTNASHLCWRLKVVVLVIITVFFQSDITLAKHVDTVLY